ncbi:hypothetical protein QYF61_016300 [Mycteria americana]|uniref:Liver-expressed antimicrobial peptide 2 n=1 Tax=Mycteria americana TaxID=33587 RepID=A0AAN7NEU0_MYCAM|nr:hypothetical protein QYF61_016300 [Mycteria americana]
MWEPDAQDLTGWSYGRSDSSYREDALLENDGSLFALLTAAQPGYKQVYFNRACYDLKTRKISSSSLKTTDLSISMTKCLQLPRAPDSHATTLFQTDCAALHRRQPRLTRQRRMTPFWRGVSLRPVGASCRDNSECITMLCR